jgi:hypothetical protein
MYVSTKIGPSVHLYITNLHRLSLGRWQSLNQQDNNSLLDLQQHAVTQDNFRTMHHAINLSHAEVAHTPDIIPL